MNPTLIRILQIWFRFTRGVDYVTSTFNVRWARELGVKIGNDCRLISVFPSTFSSEPYLVSIGDHVSMTGPQFLTHDGAVWIFREQFPDIELFGRIQVGNNVFVGYGAILLPNTVVSDCSVIAAGAVVKGKFPPRVVLGGVPARILCPVEDYFQRNREHFSYSRRTASGNKKEHVMRHLSQG